MPEPRWVWAVCTPTELAVGDTASAHSSLTSRCASSESPENWLPGLFCLHDWWTAEGGRPLPLLVLSGKTSTQQPSPCKAVLVSRKFVSPCHTRPLLQAGFLLGQVSTGYGTFSINNGWMNDCIAKNTAGN